MATRKENPNRLPNNDPDAPGRIIDPTLDEAREADIRLSLQLFPGASTDVLASMNNVSPSRFNEIRKDYEIAPERKPGKQPLHTPEILERIFALRKAGLTQAQIAAEIRKTGRIISQSAISRWLKKYRGV